jgi:hypothetical protein
MLEASRGSAVSDWGFFVVGSSRAVRRLLEVSDTADLIMLVDPHAERVLG